VQFSIDTLATGAVLLDGHALRVLFAQKWSSLHSSHVA
jgi:hypothetical protein